MSNINACVQLLSHRYHRLIIMVLLFIDIHFEVLSEVFESNKVIVTLEWTQISSFHFYNVSVFPSQSVEVVHDGRTRVQLALSYNTQYHISVVATHLCGQTYRVTNFTELYYSRLSQSN